MAPESLHIGTRPWAHVTSLATGAVGGRALVHHVLSRTPSLWDDADFDVAETSFSSYVRARAAGDDRVTALPIFVMRGFRQRCILVRGDSDLTTGAALAGRRIGLTGWPDSGNTWTRALLTDAGVDLAGIDWFLGPLTPDAPAFDRTGGVAVGPHVQLLAPGEGLAPALERGDLDAIMTPFMPPGFYQTPALRPLHPDSQRVEEDYFRARGYLPGMHLIGVRTALLEAEPELAQELIDRFERAKRADAVLRTKLQDAFPWHDQELARTVRVFGPDWLPYGWLRDRQMVADFQEALVHQELLPAPVGEQDLFPYPVEPTPQPDEEYAA